MKVFKDGKKIEFSQIMASAFKYDGPFADPDHYAKLLHALGAEKTLELMRLMADNRYSFDILIKLSTRYKNSIDTKIQVQDIQDALDLMTVQETHSS